MDSIQGAVDASITYISHQPIAALAATLVVVLVATRLWSIRSSNAQTSKPDSGDVAAVPEVPYWLPVIGHVPSMIINSTSFLAGLRKLYPNGLFALNLGGSKHIVIFRPELGSTVLNKPESVADGRAVSKHLMVSAFGWPANETDKYDVFVHEALDQYKYLLTEPYLSQMVSRTVDELRRNIADLVTFNNSPVDQSLWEIAAQADTKENLAGEPVVEVNLLELVRTFVAMMASPSLIGSDFVTNFPEFWEHFWAVDEGFLALAIKLPRWFPWPKLTRAHIARRKALQCVLEFEVAMEKEWNGEEPGASWQDLDNVSALVKARMEVFRKYNLTLQQRAVTDFSLMWAMIANSSPLIFWVLEHVYADRGLLERMRAEVAPFIRLTKPVPGFDSVTQPQTFEKIDLEGLSNDCPLLKAAYIETLRTDVNAWSYKVINEDIIVGERDKIAGKYLVPKGTYAHVAHEMHHNDPARWDNPEVWCVDRHIKWAEDDGKSKKSATVDMGTVRPFGGGVSMCKGRAFAMKEILTFTAVIITLYDIEPAGGGPWKLPKQVRAAGTRKPGKDPRVWIKRRDVGFE